MWGGGGGGRNSGCEREEEGRNGGRDCLHQFGKDAVCISAYSLEVTLSAFQNVVCFEKMMIVFECKIWEGCFVCSVYNNN